MLLHIEGFDWCPAQAGDFPADGLVRLTSAFPTDTGVWTFAPDNSRWGTGQALTYGTRGSAESATSPLVLFNLAGAFAAGHHVFAGFGMQLHLEGETGICAFLNTDGEQMFGLSISPIGYLSAYGASGSDFVNPDLLQQDSTHPLANDQWYAVEVEAYCNTADGTGAIFKVWVNNVLIINWAGALSTGSFSFHGFAVSDFALGGSSGRTGNNAWLYGGPADYEDVYIIVGDTTAPTGRLGTDPRIDCRYPTSEDTLVNYSRTGGTGASDAIGEDSCDGDTSYYRGLGLNDKAVFASTDSIHGVPTTIHGVGLTHITRKTGAGLRGVSGLINDASTDYAGNEASLTTAYGRYQSIWTARPSDSAAWTKTTVEAVKLGVKITT